MFAIRPLSQLPNDDGFCFVGVRHDDSRVECHVIVRDNIHVIVDWVGDRTYSNLKGWVNK